jgi:hypothetical protein
MSLVVSSSTDALIYKTYRFFLKKEFVPKIVKSACTGSGKKFKSQ